MQTYTLRSIESMLGIPRAVITRLIAAGFVTPSRGKHREYRFTFQDVVLLRTAYGLQAANIPARKILRSLQRLKASLPEEVPLTGLRITAVGNEIAVKEGTRQWHPESGQLLLDFELRPSQSSVSVLARPAEPNACESIDWFQRGVDLERLDRSEAERSYRRAIAAAPGHVDAYLNLGVLLGEADRHAEAVELYRQALRELPDEPLLHYNLAVALEDLQRPVEALRAYESCLRLSPAFADAHYNAARLHEALGHATRAIRHYSEYRRLQR